MKINMDSLAKNGFVRFTSDSSMISTLDIASAIGDISSISGVKPVQTLMPRLEENSEKSSYSGNFGYSEFPLHTDMAHWYLPPRFFILRCIQPADFVYTHFFSARELFKHEENNVVKRALFRPRRRLDGRLTLLHLYNGNMYRWDQFFIQPMNDHAIALQERIKDKISEATINRLVFDSPRDCILVDNWNVLHGRSSIPSTATNRVLERVYLSAINR